MPATFDCTAATHGLTKEPRKVAVSAWVLFWARCILLHRVPDARWFQRPASESPPGVFLPGLPSADAALGPAGDVGMHHLQPDLLRVRPRRLLRPGLPHRAGSARVGVELRLVLDVSRRHGRRYRRRLLADAEESGGARRLTGPAWCGGFYFRKLNQTVMM